MYEFEELMREKLSNEFVILFLEDDTYRCYYIPSYDFVVKAKEGEVLDLQRYALPVSCYLKGFAQEFDAKSKTYRYAPNTVIQATTCLCDRIKGIIKRAKKKGLETEDWKIIECRLLDSLKRHPIKQ